MSTVTVKQKILSEILSEIKSVRREMSIFIPQENLESFSNKSEILDSYKKAKKQFS